MSRFWPDGVAIAVMYDALATPTVLVWQQQRHQVARVVERWRVDVGWWHKRAWREYFQLITASGLLIEIYHDVRTDRWYLQRLYD